ncbi:MAG: hypothetical protein JWP32_2125, partial [Schumannella sp.]|nr:hypothetical protein [Schumannella sp.]
MTVPVHAHFAEWDAAYVLGALSPAERREFEDHLEECDRCRAAVSELSALPGLLGRIDDARAFALLEPGDAGESDSGPVPAPIGAPVAAVDLATRIRAAESRRRVRRTLIGVAALAAAAALASVLTLAIPALLAPKIVPDAVAVFTPQGGQPAPIDLTVDLTRTDWGTRLDMDCIYHPVPTADGYGPAQYSLWVVGTDGSEQSVSSWNSAPGTEVRLGAATGVSLDEIAQLDLRNADGTQV